MAVEIYCFSCQKTSQWESVSRRDECPHCQSDVHVCLNCQLFDRAFHHECRESQAEYVKDKDRSNFCEYFQAKGPSDTGPSADSLRQAAQALFQKKPS